MKKNILLISVLFLLASCGNANNSSNTFLSSMDNSNNVSSSEILSTNLSSIITSSSTPSIDISANNTYDYHPLSEPEVNKQLVTFNPMGNLTNVWNYYRGDNVLVAVIDSGFDYNHPEFFNLDGTSKVSDKSCYIYTNSNNVTNVEIGKEKVAITDGDSHGTMCAGLLGASVNKKGISGIAPNVDLMLIKIDKKALSMAEAFKYAADNGAKVISTSLGAYPNSNGESTGDIHFSKGFDLSNAFNKNINYAYSKGVTIVAATGNSRTTTLSYPAGCENVIGAGGLNVGSQTQIWDNGYEGSNYNGNKEYVDVFAPSEGIYAPGFDTSNNSHTYWEDAKGTSFAAPLIAGAIAMYFQKYPNHTNKDVEKALANACVDISSYNSNKNMGLGRLDVGKLLNIEEDIEKESKTPTTSINQKATKLTIYDEEGWDFRTLHLFGLTFMEGYGYQEFDEYLEHIYGPRVTTSSYQKEGTKKCYAYTDEGYIGDYYLCNGNTDHAIATEYEYVFPWWVKGAYYQIVNNSNWLPEGGNSFNYTNGYGKEIKSYFWYDSETSYDVTQVVHDNNESTFDAITVSKTLVYNNEEIKTLKEVYSIYDYYEIPNKESYQNFTFKGWFLDKEGKIPYTRRILNKDITLYGLMN